jgi:hypothetical protein
MKMGKPFLEIVGSYIWFIRYIYYVNVGNVFIRHYPSKINDLFNFMHSLLSIGLICSIAVGHI